MKNDLFKPIVNDKILNPCAKAFAKLAKMDIPSQIATINAIKRMLHVLSPMNGEPVDCVIWVPNEEVIANDYNPNSVAPPEMKLLEVSILEDGYTQPIVSFLSDTGREVVDGFHRTRVGKESEPIRQRVHGYIPVVTINESRREKGDRIAATIRHNRARGKHRIDAMSDIVIDLKRRNWSDEKIARNLGMDADEILRLSQITGLAEMFADRDFSMAWEAEHITEEDALLTVEENLDKVSIPANAIEE